MKKVLAFLPCLIVMTVIFVLSNKTGTESMEQSDNMSYGIVDVIDELFHLNLTAEQKADILEFTDRAIRKVAHFGEYMVLAATALFGVLINFGLTKKSYVCCFAFSVIYAVSDEIHQYFVPGRHAQVKDVFIDSAGALLAILIWYFIHRSYLKKVGRI